MNCEDAGWLHAWAPTYMGSVGWIRADLVGDVEPTLRDTLEKLRATSPQDHSLVKQLADRVMALGPLDEGAHEAAIRALEASGDPDGAARARQRLTALRVPEVRQAPGEPQLIFVAEGELISPLAVLDHGKLTSYPIPDAIDPEKTANTVRSFSERYFATGRAYRLYANGLAEGLALVKREEEPSCASVVASFTRVSKGAPMLAGGILTNFDLAPKTASPTPKLTEPQRRQVIDLVRSDLRSRSVNEDHIQRILATAEAGKPGLVINVGPSEGRSFPVLIATAAFESYPKQVEPDGSYIGYELRMIAEADPTGRYRLTHREFNQTDSEQNFSPRKFVTYLDIDKDGNDELIFSGSGYEWWWYEALGRSEGGWKVLVRGGGGGC